MLAAGVDLHGVHDWNLEIPHGTMPPSPAAFDSLN
jgi:hypothetical protein